MGRRGRAAMEDDDVAQFRAVSMFILLYPFSLDPRRTPVCDPSPGQAPPPLRAAPHTSPR
eukprot:m.45003 g.45003  ORF g.45003 m.45003 type:complete len:60 (-) comp15101_c0_seq1:127-306(-)